MKTNQVALAALQILSLSGGVAIDSQAVASVPKTEIKMVNPSSLASIEKSWLTIPQICKACFNAQAESTAERTSSAQALYSAFAG